MNNNILTQYTDAIHFFEQGEFERSFKELENLRKSQKEELKDLHYGVEFLIGKCLKELGKNESALKVLTDLRKEQEIKFLNIIDHKAISIEISDVYNRLNKYELALEECEYTISIANTDKKTQAIGWQNHAIANRNLNNLIESIRDLLTSLKLWCDVKDPKECAIIAEHLTRSYLFLNEMNRAEIWFHLAKIGYRLYVPKLLSSLEEIEQHFTVEKGNVIYTEILEDEARLLYNLFTNDSTELGPERLNVLDIDLYKFFEAMYKLNPEQGINAKIELEFPGSTPSEDLYLLLISEIIDMKEFPNYKKILADTFLSSKFNQTEQDIEKLNLHTPIALTKRNVRHQEKDLQHLYWEGFSPWVWGQVVTLTSLSRLYLASREHIFNLTSNLEIPVTILSLTGRTWPRSIQTKFVGLAEYETGATPAPPQLLNILTRQNLADINSNIQDFVKMGYDPNYATMLDEGGFIALLVSKLQKRGANISNLGGLPFNEINPINIPNTTHAPSNNNLMPGFVVDKFYQGWFHALKPKYENHGWYGVNNNVLRDHFVDFRKNLKQVDSIRVKHYSIPIFEAQNILELKEMANKMPEFDGTKMFFRGQTKQYDLNRTTIVSSALYGQDDIREPSLLGTAPRLGLDYDEIHSFLQLCLQDYVYKNANNNNLDLDDIHSKWVSKTITGSGDWDVAVMALAQHYGIPTHGIDITSSIEVALWFATNKFTVNKNGDAKYVELSKDDWPNDKSKWPVVYFILPVTNSLKPSIRTIKPLNDLGIESLRPERQKAAFFMGAHGLHQNRLAEALVCGVRLSPNHWNSELTYDYLFPSKDEDPIFSLMIDLKNKYRSEIISKFFDHVPNYSKATQTS